MAYEAQKCNEVNCKGFVVFENADFDFNNLEVGESGFCQFDNPICTECGKQYYVVPHYVVIGEGEDEPIQTACITEWERREKELNSKSHSTSK